MYVIVARSFSDDCCCCRDAHCSKMEMNGKKLNMFKLYFPRLLGTPLVSKQETNFSCFGRFLDALESGIGTGLVFCHSFSFTNNVDGPDCLRFEPHSSIAGGFHMKNK